MSTHFLFRSARPQLRLLSVVAAWAIFAFSTIPAHGKKQGTDETSNPAYASTPVDTKADISGKPAKPAGFIHPGVLVNQAQLEEIKKRVNAGTEPQKSAFEKLKSSPL